MFTKGELYKRYLVNVYIDTTNIVSDGGFEFEAKDIDFDKVYELKVLDPKEVKIKKDLLERKKESWN